MYKFLYKVINSFMYLYTKFNLTYIRRFLFSVVSIFLVMNYLSNSPSFAFLDLQGSMSIDDKTMNYLSKDSGPHALRSVDLTNSSTVHSLLMMTCKSCYNGYEDLAADESISAINKQGILEILDTQTMALLQSAPTVNMNVALGRSWIPGYKDNNAGVYAASDGYSFLSEVGIDALWERTSLIAYVLFVVVLIAAGFMIMLRQKIGGQVAVTVFNALPNVIIGLILVPFSFAIIGLILNISMIGTNVIAGVLGVTDPVVVTNPLQLVGELWFGRTVATQLWESGMSLIGGSTLGVGGMILRAIGSQALPVLLAGASFGIVLFFLAIAVVLAYASFSVYMTLLKAYLAIILDVIMAPLLIAFGSVPGQENLKNNLFKRVLSNALVFPGVYLFLNLSSFILQDNINIQFPYGLATGDWSQGGTNPGFTGILLKGFLSIGLFFLAAQVPNFITDFIQVDGGKGSAAAIGEARKAFSEIPIIGSLIGR